MSESLDQFRRRIERRQCLAETGMTPEEIAARIAEVQATWTDARGVIRAEIARLREGSFLREGHLPTFVGRGA